VPSVPVISVLPRDPCGDVDVWQVLAVLLAPPVTAWALRRWGGTALSRSALKLGAPNVREIPWPEGDVAIAAGMLRAGDVDGAALEMCRAYGVGEVVYEWWAARIRPR
jgi:hypothetical protein